ncbi:MAG: site-specific DNA-methyltransferase [Gemmatimonadaceae bacterium]|nr:site-specific DNA-methyltransferase [Gemmatimonadaceae bacterium]MCW5826784.1 site-specific DNA-methyltransferase [Gemmatimonadaceae bacterium]
MTRTGLGKVEALGRGDLSNRTPFLEVRKHSFGERETRSWVVQGENSEVLRALVESQPRSVRCAYLDPPYNNGENYLHYSDDVSHVTWLRDMRTRLALVRELLSEDGSLWISIDDNELHYLKVEADAVFGRQNFISTVVWEHRTTRENRRAFSPNHEYVLVYAKDARAFARTRNLLPLTPEVFRRYSNPDGDPRGPWQSVSANVQAGHATKSQFYALRAPNGRLHRPPKGRCWVYSEDRMRELIDSKQVWFGYDGNAVPRIKRFLRDKVRGLVPQTLWRAAEVSTTSQAKRHQMALLPSIEAFDTPKPEGLLRRIVEIATDPGDLVLDPYLGSGTTAAVALKTNRQFIGIERGEHVVSHAVKRLREVIRGESGGISVDVGWNGGGGFRFGRLGSRRDSRATLGG